MQGYPNQALNNPSHRLPGVWTWCLQHNVLSGSVQYINNRVFIFFPPQKTFIITKRICYDNGRCCTIKYCFKKWPLQKVIIPVVWEVAYPASRGYSFAVFFQLFVQISGRIWAVVGRGYFSHDNSHRGNVASARRVEVALVVWRKKKHKHVHTQHSTVKYGSNPVYKPNIFFLACPDAVLMNHLAFQCLMDLAKPNLLLHKYLWHQHQEVLPNLSNGKLCNY